MKKKNNPDRELWNGFRPSVIQPRKGHKKKDRRENKQICRDAKKERNE
ncbi:MAG: hypothetical protein LIR50_21925 [Bacillota bacterium]|nr:hypothetical protein [Bacillota bacterium]